MPWETMRGAGRADGGELGQRDRWLLLLGEPFIKEPPTPRWFLFTTAGAAFCARDHANKVLRRQDKDYDANGVFALAMDRIRCVRGARIETHNGDVRVVDLKIPHDDPRWVEILNWLNAERNVENADL